MDLSRPLYENYPWWLAILIGLAGALILLGPPICVGAWLRHRRQLIEREADRERMRAETKAWAAARAAAHPEPDLGRLTIRSRPAPAAPPRRCGPATRPPCPEPSTRSGRVAPRTAAGRERVPEPSRPVAPTLRSPRRTA